MGTASKMTNVYSNMKQCFNVLCVVEQLELQDGAMTDSRQPGLATKRIERRTLLMV